MSTYYVLVILCYKLYIAYFLLSLPEVCEVDIILIFTEKGNEAQRLRNFYNFMHQVYNKDRIQTHSAWL